MARETIEALLNPSLKVSRPVSACKKCRMAKIKCDGKLPACTACERAGKAKECSSANDEFARGKERSYVAALEIAAQKLQKKIDDNKLDGFISRRDSLVMLAHGRPTLQRQPVSLMRRKEAGNVDELVSDFGFLTVNATSRDFQGFSATMSFAKMLKSIAVKQDLPKYSDLSLPPREATTGLVDHYFDSFHAVLPFLSETEFQTALSRLYQDPNADSKSSFDVWCFRLVMAISAASLCQLQGDEQYNIAIYNASAAMEVAEHVLHPGSIAGIQALLLLTQYALVDPEHFDSWYLVGMASRLLVDLGLHCEPTRETKMSKHTLDRRRRIFYCTYALDRLVATSLGMAFSFTDDSAPNGLLPTLATDQEARSPSQLFTRSVRPSLYLFDLRRVQSAYYQQTRWSSRKEWKPEAIESYISSTLEDIRAWQASLPSTFSESHLRVFYLESVFTQALVLSPNTVIKYTNISDTYKKMFFSCAVEFAERLVYMVHNADLRPSLSYAYFCRARFISRQFQNLMWSNFDLILRPDQTVGSGSALENCNRALSFLNHMTQILEWPKQRWGISAFQEVFVQESAVLLSRLQSRQQEYSSVQSTQPTQTTPPATNRTYSDPTLSYGMPYPDNAPPTTYAQQQNAIFSTIPPYDPTALSYPPTLPNDTVPYSGPAMHRSNLVRENEWASMSGQVDANLPPGSLPRRGYQFQGGHG